MRRKPTLWYSKTRAKLMLDERGEAAFITRSLLTNRAMMGMDDVSKSRRKQPNSLGVKLEKSWWMLLMFTLTLVAISKAQDTLPVATSRLATTQYEVIDVVVPVTPDRFLKAFILDERFTHNFFKLSKDKDVRLGSWARTSSSAGGRGRAVTAMTRNIEYSHPVKTRFPGMPSHAKTYKKQEYAYDSRQGVLELEEHLRFEGIPKADHFTVDTAWKVRSLDGKRAKGKSSSQVTISLRVNFLKKTILRKTIESQTLAEQGESLRNWMATAQGTLADQGSTGVGKVGGANGFQAAGGGGGAPLPSCSSAGIRSFLSRSFGGCGKSYEVWKMMTSQPPSPRSAPRLALTAPTCGIFYAVSRAEHQRRNAMHRGKPPFTAPSEVSSESIDSLVRSVVRIPSPGSFALRMTTSPRPLF